MHTLHHCSAISSAFIPPTRWPGHSAVIMPWFFIHFIWFICCVSSRFRCFSIVIWNLSDSKPDIISPCDIQLSGNCLSPVSLLCCINFVLSFRLGTMSVTSRNLMSVNHPITTQIRQNSFPSVLLSLGENSGQMLCPWMTFPFNFNLSLFFFKYYLNSHIYLHTTACFSDWKTISTNGGYNVNILFVGFVHPGLFGHRWDTSCLQFWCKEHHAQPFTPKANHLLK